MEKVFGSASVWLTQKAQSEVFKNLTPAGKREYLNRMFGAEMPTLSDNKETSSIDAFVTRSLAVDQRFGERRENVLADAIVEGEVVAVRHVVRVDVQSSPRERPGERKDDAVRLAGLIRDADETHLIGCGTAGHAAAQSNEAPVNPNIGHKHHHHSHGHPHPTVQDPDPGGPVELVAGPGVEVRAQRLDVGRLGADADGLKFPDGRVRGLAARFVEVPRCDDCSYQAIQVGSAWYVSTDYENHQTSLTVAQSHVDDDGMLLTRVQALVISTGDQTVVVDTCIGNDKQRDVKAWNNLQLPFLDRIQASFGEVGLVGARGAQHVDQPEGGYSPSSNAARLAHSGQAGSLTSTATVARRSRDDGPMRSS